MASSLLVLMSMSCGGSKSGTSTPAPGQPGADGTAFVPPSTPGEADPDGGLAFTLEEVAGTKPSEARVRTLEGTPLSAKQSAALWQGVPPLIQAKSDVVPFAKREGSAPPPTATVVVQQPFPPAPAQAGAAPAKQPLEVVRFAPEGDAQLVRELSVTFNQPMVPLTSHAQSVAGELPVQLSPMPKGQFRWIGTSTLLFTAEPRFPFATEYTVTIAQGAKSLAGTSLAKEKSFRFQTPRLALLEMTPSDEGETSPLTPLIFLSFNQKVDAQKLLAALTLEAQGKKRALRLATPEEIAANDDVRARTEGLAGEGMREHGVVLRPVEPLPYAAKVALTIPKGSVAGEGPRPTAEAIRKTFATHGPLSLEKVTCHGQCPPGGGVQIELTNPLDPKRFEPSWLRIEPEVEFQLSPSGDSLYLTADTEARTEYKLVLSAAVSDVFGQTLGKEVTATFKVGDASPELTTLPALVLLDPKAPARALALESLNVDELTVEVRRVEPKDYLAFARARERMNENSPPALPGKVVSSQTIALKDKRNTRVTSSLDLSKGLTNGLGHVIVSVKPRPAQGPDFWLQHSLAWVQSTELGVDAFWDGAELVAWSTSLADGSPQKDVNLTLEPEGLRGKSDADGLVRLKLPQGDGGRVRVLVAQRGSDVALLPEHPWGAHGGGAWSAQPPGQGLRAHVFDDRGLYRPGETVHLKGWLRLARGQASIELPRGTIDALSYEVTSQGGEVFAKGSTKLNDLGGFETSFALPRTVHLGQASVHFQVPGKELGELWHGFRIEEYRRPEYEVSVRTAEPVHFVGSKLKLEATASYHAGGGLAEAKTVWTVTSRSAHFTPPGREGFLFGEQPMFWERMGWPREQGKTETLTGRTDARGRHAIAVLPARAQPAFVHELEVSARVEDLSRQGFADQTTLLVHPAQVYVGLRTTRSFTSEGEPIVSEAIVTDLDGKAVAGRAVTLSLIELEGKFERGEFRTIETEVERCNVTSGNDVVKCELHAKRAGSYRIAARVTDAQQRPSDTRLRHWVSGESGGPMVSAQPNQVELIPDKQSYAPGDTAHVMLRAPFAPAEALVRVTHERIVELRRIHLSAPTSTFDVKIADEHVPNLQVLVELVGRSKSEDGSMELPARAAGSLDLPVSLDARRLSVEVTPAAKQLEPGAKTRVKVVVRDAKGTPQKSADLALIVVDEAILQMLEREEPDPLAAMHPHVDPAGGSSLSRDYVIAPAKQREARAQRRGRGGSMRTSAGVLLESAAPPMMAMAADKSAGGAVGNAASSPVKMRKLFEPLALFAGSLRTDAQGVAQADVTMPDTLTRYRVLAVAAAGDVQFGRGESSITARKLLMLRPAMARFVNLGDELAVPVLVQNEGDEPLTVDVGVRAANFELTGAKDKRISVPAHDRVEVRFAGKSQKPGTVRLSFVARAKQLSDGTELALPAFTPATDEAFASYGDLASDGAIAQALALPKDVSLLWGGLDVSLSSTEVAALTDALLSVLDTPFEFPEQSASRILTVLATRDILAAFAAEGIPPRAELDAMMTREISRLQGLQRGDGGFGYYDARSKVDPFVSVHVSHALARAQAEKLQVPGSLSEPLRNYVRGLVRLSKEDTSAEERATILAYAAFSERAWGANDAELAKQALASAPLARQPAEALGWLLPVLTAQQSGRVPELVRTLSNRVTETAGKAEISSTGRDGRHVTLSSSKRETAVVLDALLSTNQAQDLAPKLARGLLAGRTRGRWQGTQENVFALLALRTFFDAYERDVPQFSARAFLDATLAADQRFQGRSTTQAFTHVPMAWLAQHKSTKLTLEKRGQGRLYYRLALAYAPSSFVLPAADHGFVVERRYEAVDAPEDVQRDVEGGYRIRAGARVRVVVTMVAPGTRHHVALVDPLPAGLEAINPALAVSEKLPEEPGRGRPGPIVPLMHRISWFGPWFDHQNLRDERAEAHASQVGAGVYTYTYYARATTPGRYIAPPAKAEELYAPETFGRGESARVTVE